MPFILKTIKEKNYSLGMSLSVAKPVELNENSITLAFIFELQKDRVETPENLALIEQILLEEFGSNVKIKVVVDTDLKITDIAPAESLKTNETGKIEQPPSQDVNQAIDAFGGEVVDGLS